MPKMPERNHIIIYEKCEPPFQSGDNHQIRISQRLYEDAGNVLKNIDTPDNQLPRNQEQFFRVVGPRFSLMPADIHGAFPPPNSQVPYDDRLPQIVMRRRTLPWERPLTINGLTTPWMALILIRNDEIEDNLVQFHDSMSITDIANHINANGGSITTSPKERALKSMAVDIRESFFRSISPTAKELQLLTHVRQVNTQDKELLGMDKDGWFAVTVGNRLPTISFDHTAVLVSLEGHENHIPSAREALGASLADTLNSDHTNSDWLRFVALAKWEFRCDGAGSFESIMKAIPTRGGVAMLGQSKSVATGQSVSASNQLALDTGHVPLQHQTRIGERTIAWYRGGLTPVPVDRHRNIGPFHSSDQARRIDPYTGLENLGYAAAFEVGRLMALSDKRFAAELMHWRRTVHMKKQKRIEFDRFKQLGFHDRIPDIRDLLGKMEIAMFRGMFEDLLKIDDIEQFARHILPTVDPTGILTLGRTLPGLDMSPDSINAQLFGLTPDIATTPGLGLMPGYGTLIDSYANDIISSDSFVSFENIMQNPNVLQNQLQHGRDNLLNENLQD